MKKKYEIIKEDDYYRIKALKDFQLITGEVIKLGDLGGRIHGEHNLSQEGNCWISYYAGAFWKSSVKDNAVMKDNSIAFNNSTVSGNAVMKDYSWTKGDSIITENAVLQAFQRIQYGTVTTDLFGTKDWAGALYAELGVKPQNNKIVLYKKVWKTDDDNVFKSDYYRNFLYKIGKISRVINVNEDILEHCARGLHFTSLEFVNGYGGDTILECEVEVPDIVTVQDSKVRARKCKVIRVYKEE